MRTHPQKAAEDFAKPGTRPIILVHIDGFSSPLKLSSRGDQIYNGSTYLSAGIEYDGSSIEIRNEDGRFTQSLQLARNARVIVFKSGGDGPFVDADWYEDFRGTAGAIEFSSSIAIELKEFPVRAEPHFYVRRPTFNHLVRPGTIVLTTTGQTKLEPAPPPKPSPYVPGTTIPPWQARTVVPAAIANLQRPIQPDNLLAENDVIPWIFGAQQVAPKVFAMHYNAATNVWTVGYLIGIGEIDSIEDVLIDDAAPVGGVTVNTYLGTNSPQTFDPTPQVVDPLLAAAISGYADDLLINVSPGAVVPSWRHCAYIVVQWDMDLHYDHWPRVVVNVTGLKMITQTSLLGFVYTETPAWFLAEFIRNLMGATVDEQSVRNVATLNETPPIVDPGLPFGGIARRSGCGVTLDQARDPREWIEILRMYAGCFIHKRGATYVLAPDAPGDPVRELDAGDFEVEPGPDFRVYLADSSVSPSVVTVEFTRALTSIGTLLDVWRRDTARYVIDENDDDWRESPVSMPGIQQYAQAYWEARERAMKLSRMLRFSAIVTDNNTDLEVGDLVRITHARLAATTDFRLTEAKMIGRRRKRLVGVEHSNDDYADSTWVPSDDTGDGTSGIIGEL